MSSSEIPVAGIDEIKQFTTSKGPLVMFGEYHEYDYNYTEDEYGDIANIINTLMFLEDFILTNPEKHIVIFLESYRDDKLLDAYTTSLKNVDIILLRNVINQFCNGVNDTIMNNNREKRAFNKFARIMGDNNYTALVYINNWFSKWLNNHVQWTDYADLYLMANMFKLLVSKYQKKYNDINTLTELINQLIYDLDWLLDTYILGSTEFRNTYSTLTFIRDLYCFNMYDYILKSRIANDILYEEMLKLSPSLTNLSNNVEVISIDSRQKIFEDIDLFDKILESVRVKYKQEMKSDDPSVLDDYNTEFIKELLFEVYKQYDNVFSVFKNTIKEEYVNFVIEALAFFEIKLHGDFNGSIEEKKKYTIMIYESYKIIRINIKNNVENDIRLENLFAYFLDLYAILLTLMFLEPTCLLEEEKEEKNKNINIFSVVGSYHSELQTTVLRHLNHKGLINFNYVDNLDANKISSIGLDSKPYLYKNKKYDFWKEYLGNIYNVNIYSKESLVYPFSNDPTIFLNTIEKIWKNNNSDAILTRKFLDNLLLEMNAKSTEHKHNRIIGGSEISKKINIFNQNEYNYLLIKYIYNKGREKSLYEKAVDMIFSTNNTIADVPIQDYSNFVYTPIQDFNMSSNLVSAIAGGTLCFVNKNIYSIIGVIIILCFLLICYTCYNYTDFEYSYGL